MLQALPGFASPYEVSRARSTTPQDPRQVETGKYLPEIHPPVSPRRALTSPEMDFRPAQEHEVWKDP